MIQKLEKSKLLAAICLFVIWAFLRFLLMMKLRQFFFHHVAIHGSAKILFNHAFIVLEAIILFLAYALIFKSTNLNSLHENKYSKKQTIALGSLAGIVISLISIPVAFYFGMKVSPQFSFIEIFGNLFSNAAEEIIYRGILFSVVISASRSKYLAIIISSIAFGIGHWDMPILFQTYVAFVGIILGITYIKAKKLSAPYIAHMISDVFLDSIFH